MEPEIQGERGGAVGVRGGLEGGGGRAFNGGWGPG